jgi:hypothetical protein
MGQRLREPAIAFFMGEFMLGFSTAKPGWCGQ